MPEGLAQGGEASPWKDFTGTWQLEGAGLGGTGLSSPQPSLPLSPESNGASPRYRLGGTVGAHTLKNKEGGNEVSQEY